MYLDFAEIKAQLDIVEVAKFLKLDLKESNGEVLQYRSPCPRCKAGGDRALAITPSKGYFCNAVKRGGDVLALYAHIQGVGFRESAQQLGEHFGLFHESPKKAQAPAPAPSPAPAPQAVEPQEGLKPLEKLDTEHELLKTINLPGDVAVKLGAGYAAKGLMRGYVALPLRLPTGQLIGYIGVKEAKLPKQWHMG